MSSQEIAPQGLRQTEKFDILVNADRAILVMDQLPGRSNKAVLVLFGPDNKVKLRKNPETEIALVDMAIAGFEVLQRVPSVTVIELDGKRMVGQYEARVDLLGDR